MFAEVESGFALFIPLEPHDLSVRTFCAYVKNERVKSSGEVSESGAERPERWGKTKHLIGARQEHI